jgi:peptidoglycan/xylan/chitin deacetylase (PgdA/CDA1 family)
LKKDGHTIGSHSWSHPSNISSLDSKLINYEWEKSIDVLSTILNDSVIAASIPGGFYSNDVANIAARNGIKFLFTSEPTLQHCQIDNCLIIGRYSVQRGMDSKDVLKLLEKNSFQQKKQYFYWNSKKVLKKLLGNKYLTLRKAILKH